MRKPDLSLHRHPHRFLADLTVLKEVWGILIQHINYLARVRQRDLGTA